MKNGHIKHVVWDWNGTILDDVHLCVEIVNEILCDRGLPTVQQEDYRECFDFPVSIYYKRLGLPASGPVFEEISHHFIEEYHRRWTCCNLQSKVRETIRALASTSVGQSLLSAGKQEHVEIFIEHHDLHGYFSSVSGAKNIFAEGKVELGRRHVGKLGLEPSECLMVGDTFHDYEVAQAIGAECLLFSGGHHSEQRLLESGAAVIACLSEVSARLIG